MNFEWLEDFLMLAREGNFSRAAEYRNITQPAFSRRIHSLEEWVGTPLFHRTTRGVLSTPAGESLLAYAEDIVRTTNVARARALEAAGRAETTLLIAATHALSFTFFPNWIRKYAPHETINLVSDSMEACEGMMLRGDADFLLHHNHPAIETAFAPRQFRSIKVGEDMLVPVCRVDDEGCPRWSLSDHGDNPIPYLAYSEASGLGRILQAEWSRNQRGFGLATTMTSRLAAALLTMVCDGEGLAWLPLSLAKPGLDNGMLIDAGSGDFSVPVDIALTRPVARLSAASERFWTALH